jgi:lactoylglutathione lyase
MTSGDFLHLHWSNNASGVPPTFYRVGFTHLDLQLPMNRLKQIADILKPTASIAKMAVPDVSLWKMNHTMIRVKDPVRSIAFYQKLGMTQIDKLSMTEFKFDLYFIAFDASGTSPSAGRLRSDRQGLLELTHNYGTETDDSYSVSNGNEEPYLGFEHLGITVHDLEQTLQELQGLPFNIAKTSQDGKATVAIVQDPDGYFVELTEGGINTLNSTGLRIKDPKVSLPWYTESLGMQVLKTVEAGDRTIYWVGYVDGASEQDLFECEGLLKLIWIQGSEKREGKVYHDGNAQPQGFGHLGKRLPVFS